MPNFEKRSFKKEIEDHIHRWASPDLVSEICMSPYNGNPCIKVRVGIKEFERRQEIWKKYFEAVQSSESKKDFDLVKVAYKTRNLPELKKVLERVEAKISGSSETSYLRTPSFPDPEANSDIYILED